MNAFPLRLRLILLTFFFFFFAPASSQEYHAADMSVEDAVKNYDRNKFNFRIRIYEKDDSIKNLQLSISSNGGNFEINRINKEPFLFINQIYNERIEFEYDLNGNHESFTWPDDTTVPDDDVEKAICFRKFMEQKLLGVSANLDPKTYFLVRSNQFVTLHFNYEYNIGGSLNDEQKHIVRKCYIDNQGVITLPVFFDNINGNVANGDRGTDESTWFDARSNSYKLDIGVKRKSISYYQAAKIITHFYISRLGNSNGIITQFSVDIEPEDFFAEIEVVFKKKSYLLPFEPKVFGEYFSQTKIRKRIRLKKKCFRATIISRPNAIDGKDRLVKDVKYNPSRDNKQSKLNAGDIIFLK